MARNHVEDALKQSLGLVVHQLRDIELGLFQFFTDTGGGCRAKSGTRSRGRLGKHFTFGIEPQVNIIAGFCFVIDRESIVANFEFEFRTVPKIRCRGIGKVLAGGRCIFGLGRLG